MTTREQYARLEELFLAACELGPHRRAEYLAQVSLNDPSVARQLEQLLLQHETVAGALNAGDGAHVLADALDEPGDRSSSGASSFRATPQRLGPYRVIRQLGEGGMGVVYEAEQDEPKRRVALKVIRDGFATEQAVARFHREVQVLGQLRHPGIAQIYDADTSASAGCPPYFVMELIEGSPLLKFAEQHALSVRQRLELILSVCDALQHAHEHGLVHRDLKPGNILVETLTASTGAAGPGTAAASRAGDPCGRIRIIDFGVARSETLDTLTIPNGLVGTVAYMSPEQVVGDEIDARSDVYSIGVIAFELLTGRLPYTLGGKFIPEAARIIREEEPTSLSSVDRSLRGDIEVIVGKALAKNRDDRYASAAELAADIRRHLDDQVIVARAPSTAARVRRFARRRRGLLLSGGLALGGAAMLVAGGLALHRYADGARLPLHEFRSADEWLATNPGAEAWAFDQFYPGVDGANACLAGEAGPVLLRLAGGTVTVSAFLGDGTPACAIGDRSRGAKVSDAQIRPGGTVVLEFDPPISAFFGMFGSLEVGANAIARVFDAEQLLGVAITRPSTDPVGALGHGFVSSTPVTRIEFKASDSGGWTLGAFCYLAEDEPSLGTTTFRAPEGPDEIAQLDFACVFVRRGR